MIETDVPRVAEIHVMGWRNTYRDIIKEEILFSKMLVSKRIDYFKKALKENKEEIYVYDDGIIKAMLTIGKSRDKDKKEGFELCGIYVDPFMQGQGIGNKIIAFCEDEAKKHGHREIILWTFKENKKRVNFMRSMVIMLMESKILLGH